MRTGWMESPVRKIAFLIQFLGTHITNLFTSHEKSFLTPAGCNINLDHLRVKPGRFAYDESPDFPAFPEGPSTQSLYSAVNLVSSKAREISGSIELEHV